MTKIVAHIVVLERGAPRVDGETFQQQFMRATQYTYESVHPHVR